jgi:hypothetical protein
VCVAKGLRCNASLLITLESVSSLCCNGKRRQYKKGTKLKYLPVDYYSCKFA